MDELPCYVYLCCHFKIDRMEIASLARLTKTAITAVLLIAMAAYIY